VGSGKTALTLALCRHLRESHSLGVVTNDIFTREDGEFLIRNEALTSDRILAVETGGCPHAAIREDVSLNVAALEQLMERFQGDIDLLFVESGGDNLAAHFGRELADYTVYVIDVSGGDKIPRKGGARHHPERFAGDQQNRSRAPGGRRSGGHAPRLPEDARRRPLPVLPGQIRPGRIRDRRAYPESLESRHV